MINMQKHSTITDLGQDVYTQKKALKLVIFGNGQIDFSIWFNQTKQGFWSDFSNLLFWTSGLQIYFLKV